ncbi:MAG: DUF3883 domain-containing protein, partial [Candidatus Taylorbacteria bacterium]|nr:DUF3883 domain-containing protein [Candidatus Taylorbacteria bacterium]
EKIGAIFIEDNGKIRLNPLLNSSLDNLSSLSEILLSMIINTAKKDEVFYEIFNQDYLSYDIVHNLIQLEISAIPLRFTGFRRLLVNMGFLSFSPDLNIQKWVINPKYKNMFDLDLMPEIKRRRMSLASLQKMLDLNKKLGNEAEEFILDYEKKRLALSKNSMMIRQISNYDVGAGYDIISYNSVDSKEYDRFIEVKSFSGTPSFHWSRNEIDIARIKKQHYFLYLVDREHISKMSYIPLIIENPYEQIIEKSSTWNKRIEEYFVMKD